MASGMQINSTAIPSPMDERGAYKFEPPAEVARNGQGLSVTAGASRVIWRWPYLSASDMAWWVTTLLSGAASAAFTQAKFFNHAQTLTTYTYCIVYRPQYDRIENGLFMDVSLEIGSIR